MKTTLTDAGYTISKETKMDASLIGGVEGIKYTTDKGKVEIYKFEKTSEGYKKAESGKVTLEGFGDFDAKTNNGYVLLTQDLPTDIIDAFANMK